jgi:hypothetical protein
MSMMTTNKRIVNTASNSDRAQLQDEGDHLEAGNGRLSHQLYGLIGEWMGIVGGKE